MPRLDEARPALLAALGVGRNPVPAPHQGQGPGDDPASRFEAIAAVALDLIAPPLVAAKARAALRDAGLLRPEPLAKADPLELDDVFKQAGVRLASRALRPLQKLARWAVEREFEDHDPADIATDTLRDEWRSINGVGPSLADTLLLFALGRPVYPLDRATYRILVRHDWLDPSADHDEARAVAESIAPDDPATLASLAPALARVGRDFCKVAAPRCDGCPLSPFLPDGGPREAE